ncbi:MAG: S1 RNA-binding domain-containing protein [bacterium]|nr:S1 RNA-binding domain-containing protein [bacterium]
MSKYKKQDIIKGKITGIKDYGVFVNIDDEYNGLIHISEISYGYVKNINDFVKVGEKIYAEIVDNDVENNHLKLSIKNIDYRYDGVRIANRQETKNGFIPLKQHLNEWISNKIKEITDKM